MAMHYEKSGKKVNLTWNQRTNLSEWFRRMADEGVNSFEATRTFNHMDAEQQQRIIRRPWYSLDTGKPINRPLT